MENNSRNIKAVFFKLGNSNVHHKRNRMNDTDCVVVMATPFAPISFCKKKTHIPICNLLKWERGSCSEHKWFLTLPIRLVGVDDPWEIWEF